MSDQVNPDVIGAVTSVVYAVQTLTSNGEYEAAYHLALSIKDISARCGISQSALDSVNNIVNMLADKVANKSEHRTVH